MIEVENKQYFASEQEGHPSEVENGKAQLRKLVALHPEIIRIQAAYNGSGDEGYVDDVSLLDSEGKPLNPGSADNSPYAEVEEAVRDLAEELLQAHWPSWETSGDEVDFQGHSGESDGASGKLIIDPVTLNGSIHHEIMVRVAFPQTIEEF